jgi:hypothetical protein
MLPMTAAENSPPCRSQRRAGSNKTLEELKELVDTSEGREILEQINATRKAYIQIGRAHV